MSHSRTKLTGIEGTNPVRNILPSSPNLVETQDIMEQCQGAGGSSIIQPAPGNGPCCGIWARCLTGVPYALYYLGHMGLIFARDGPKTSP